MASLRAHLYDRMVRLGVRLRLGRRPRLATIRAVFGQKGFAPPAGVAFTPGRLGGVPGEWVRAGRPERARPHLLYLHGGGFVGCSPLTHRAVTAAFARAGFHVFAPDYRLAPEHPFPAAIEDTLAAWSALAAQGPAAVAGDSAGGNLALVAMLLARDRGLPLPAAAALFSPPCDFLGRGASIAGNARRDAMFCPEVLDRFRQLYLAGAGPVDPADPRLSPIEGDLSGLPPLLIHAAEGEMLRDDSVALAAGARAAGVRAELRLWPVVPHAWQLANGFLPEARRSLFEAAAFLRRELAAQEAETETGAVEAAHR